jgi:penicillin-binding protein-related factor A (putative recombinase)
VKSRTPEGILTVSIRQLLKSIGIFHWKQFGGPMSTPGIPDIIGCYKGRMIAIEVKAPKGKVSPYQEQFIRQINEAGGLAFVARDIDTVIDQLGLQDRFLLR